MSRVLLINASAPAYNLGMEKAAQWFQRQGYTVDRGASYPAAFGKVADVVWVSAVFSWHVPAMISAAQAALENGCEVEVGGPGTFGVREYIKEQTGIEPQSKPDPRIEGENGKFLMVFWSRGCPAKNCTLGFPKNGALPICSVPEMEGWRYTLYPDRVPARLIADNNLSALPRQHQEHIIERTLSAGIPKVDANSGFEPRSIKPWVVEIWKRLPLLYWRFAYDELAERDAVLRAISLMDEHGISRRKLHIYSIAGNEPIAECQERVRQINEWGAVPIVQRRKPLDYIGGPLPTLHDWTEQGLIDFQRWGNRLGKGMPFQAYKRGLKLRPKNKEQQFLILQ
jgi:hypothetical protein